MEEIGNINGRNGVPGGVLLFFPWVILLLFSQLIWKVGAQEDP